MHYGGSRREKKRNRRERLSKEIIVESFPPEESNKHPNQETQTPPLRMDLNQPSPRHSMIKLLNSKAKRDLESSKGEGTHRNGGLPQVVRGLSG